MVIDMKHASIETYTERYCDCPHCGIMITEYWNVDNDYFDGRRVACPECDRTFIIDRVND